LARGNEYEPVDEPEIDMRASGEDMAGDEAAGATTG
jgi:hypothetical protein